MQIAHLILAHNNPQQVEKLVKRLLYKDDVVFIHVDKKVRIENYNNLRELQNVFFVKKRVPITWGAFSIVEATVNGFSEIMRANGSCQFVNLLSGADYPLKTPEQIHEYLSKNEGKTFMSYMPIADEWHEALTRITKYHFTHYKFIGQVVVQHIFNFIMPKRKFPDGLVAVGRSQWFTASTNSIRYILEFWETHKKFRDFIKLTWGADEFVFQTILYNSPLREQMVNDNLRYIDWSAGGASPKTFTLADRDSLFTSDKLFARKFDLQKHADIIALIDKKLDNQG
jgi:hypothetical protein